MPETREETRKRTVSGTQWVLSIIQRRFLLLFLFLVASLAFYPLAEHTSFGYVLFRILGGVAILLSVYAVSRRRRYVIIGMLFAIPALAQYLRIFRFDTSVLSLSNISLSLTFDMFIIIVMFRHIFANQKPNSETVFGALCIYMLIAFTFTGIYELVDRFQPSAFYLDPVTNTHTVLNRFDFIYYSFATMTALGASGITAVSNEARSLTVIQALLGIFYLAVLIARLMDAYRNTTILT
ncbi:MAG TPA: ion channel [Acidobacteriaceae bacterium]|nr:ion channel [Acidobacteriaceae bacterium]